MIPELDNYDVQELASDHGDEEELDYNERLKVDQLLNKRDEEYKRSERDKVLDNIIGYQDRDIPAPTEFKQYDIRRGDEEDEEEERVYREREVNLEAFDVPLREWIAEHRTRREIENRFYRFLTEFKWTKVGEVYMPKIR